MVYGSCTDNETKVTLYVAEFTCCSSFCFVVCHIVWRCGLTGWTAENEELFFDEIIISPQLLICCTHNHHFHKFWFTLNLNTFDKVWSRKCLLHAERLVQREK